MHDRAQYAVIHDEPLGTCRTPYRYLPINQTLEETRGQRVPEHEASATRIAQPISEIAQHEPRAEKRSTDRPSRTQQPGRLYPGHHHSVEQHQLSNWPPQMRELVAKQSTIELRWLERPKSPRGPGEILPVVGMLLVASE